MLEEGFSHFSILLCIHKEENQAEFFSGFVYFLKKEISSPAHVEITSSVANFDKFFGNSSKPASGESL